MGRAWSVERRARLRVPRSQRVAEAAAAVRLKQSGLTWPQVAAELGYVSGQAALHAARRFAGYSAAAAVPRCRSCGEVVARNGGRGRLPEYCEAHRGERVAERARLRTEEQKTTRRPRTCVGCGAELEPTRGRQRTRCPSCAEQRRLVMRRRRDSKRSAASNELAIAQGRTRAAWKRLRAEAAERDGQRCRGCGATEKLQPHLDPALNGDHGLATLADVTTLCARCHARLHAQLRRAAA
jgi:DNA-directed RNA polymerase subunit RPC12/RpoP